LVLNATFTATTMLGSVLRVSLTIFWASTPDMRLSSSFTFLVWTRNAWSFLVSPNAYRSTAMRAFGTPGGAANGLPVVSGANRAVMTGALDQ